MSDNNASATLETEVAIEITEAEKEEKRAGRVNKLLGYFLKKTPLPPGKTEAWVVDKLVEIVLKQTKCSYTSCLRRGENYRGNSEGKGGDCLACMPDFVSRYFELPFIPNGKCLGYIHRRSFYVHPK